MGDFGERKYIDTDDNQFEQEMGFKIKKPKITISKKISVPKIISKPIVAVTKPVESVTSAIVKDPVSAVTTSVSTSFLPAAIVASSVPGVSSLTSPVTEAIKSSALPVTQVVAPVVAAPLSMVSASLADKIVSAALPTVPTMPSQVQYSEDTSNAVLDTTPAALISSDSSSEEPEEKKGNAGAVVGGLAVAGFAAYMLMKE
jgi:hypothetical protein